MVNLIWSVVILALLSGCGWDGTPTRNNDFVPLTSIKIEAVTDVIAAHTSTKLTAIGDYSGLFTRDITDKVVWTSNTPAVANFVTSEQPGRITGFSPGSAVLTARSGSVSTTYDLDVSSATIFALTIDPDAAAVAKGLTSQFSVFGTFSDSTVQDLTFDATWASAAPDVASISDAAANKGFVRALGIGTATIRATFDDVNVTSILTVTEPVLRSITLTPASPSILSLSRGSFKATGKYTDDSTVDITSLATWSSSKTAIATIAAGGTATTLEQGSTTISASLDGISGATDLNVTGGNLTAITLSAYTFTLVKDSVVRITATGTFNNGSARDITGAVTWSTANASVATVTPSGGNLAWLKALAATPQTEITATYGSGSSALSAKATLTASIPQITSVTPSPTVLEQLAVGTSSRFTLTAYNNGLSQDVTASADWKSSAESTATVGNVGRDKGRVSGVATGSTTISAEYGGKTVIAVVTIRPRTLQSLVISGSTTIGSGNQVKFSATAHYNDGTLDVTEDAIWSVDDSNVVVLADSVNQPGQVVAVDSGSAVLTASFGDKTQTTKITVP